jgi:hypothetical protein
LCKNIKYISDKVELSNLLSQGIYSKLKEKFKNEFKNEFSEKDIRLLICSVEENSPLVYSTAFIFLSFYGMARNLAMVCIIMLVFEHLLIIKTHEYPLYSIVYLIIGIIFFFHYIRFRKYFLCHIASGYLLNKTS